MKKIVRLTESDVVRLVKRIVSEQPRGRDEEGELDFEFSDKMVLLRNRTGKSVQKYLSKLPITLVFLSIIDCDGADFSDIDLCDFPNLSVVRLTGTPNNFAETQDECYDEMGPDMYLFNAQG